MNEHLKLSPAGANLIHAFEKCHKHIGGGKYKAYVDPVGVLTIGWGHTNAVGQKFDKNSVWSKAYCDSVFHDDVRVFEAAVHRTVKIPLNQNQFDALVSFAYNAGPGNLKKLVQGRNAEQIARAFARYNRGGGKVLSGLVRRRATEALLFQGIADLNYDGRPDKIQPEPEEEIDLSSANRVDAAPETDEPEVIEDAMPQQVDAPEPPKAAYESKTIWATIASAFTGMIAVLSQAFDRVSHLITDPTVLLVMTVVIVGAGAFVIHDRNKKLEEDGV